MYNFNISAKNTWTSLLLSVVMLSSCTSDFLSTNTDPNAANEEDLLHDNLGMGSLITQMEYQIYPCVTKAQNVDVNNYQKMYSLAGDIQEYAALVIERCTHKQSLCLDGFSLLVLRLWCEVVQSKLVGNSGQGRTKLKFVGVGCIVETGVLETATCIDHHPPMIEVFMKIDNQVTIILR